MLLTGNNKRNNYFRIDLYLLSLHIILLLISYTVSYYYPYIVNSSKNLILLLFILIAVCELIPALFITGIVLPHLDQNIKFIKTKKFFLMILYWISSFFIMTFIGSSDFFYENESFIALYLHLYFLLLFIYR